MSPHGPRFPRRERAFTILEVLVAALLIAIAMGSILAVNSQAIHTLRATHQTAASSQVLQQRIEMIRARPWPEVSSAPALLLLMGMPTESEQELGDTRVVEYVKATVPNASAMGPIDSAESFTIRREGGVASTASTLDLGAAPSLLFEGAITWRDRRGAHRRVLRTIVCRAGLTRSGLFGSPVGRAGGHASPLFAP
jgi:type II secretory pathway pseudopilin PulG